MHVPCACNPTCARASAPPDVARPSDRLCANGGRVDYKLAKRESVTHCLLLPGETIVVPENWWHATCNLDPYTIGVGGQLWRPGMQNTFEGSHERTKPLVIRDSYDASTYTRAVALPDVIEPIVFEPDEPLGDLANVAASVSPSGEVGI